MQTDPLEFNQLLFLCTGNYYRSRTAEELFNHYAALSGLDWRATSKGLREDMENSGNVGPMAEVALDFLDKNNIPAQGRARFPLSVKSSDFIDYERVICLDRTEHLPMLEKRFPLFADEVEYWDFPDMPLRTPAEILPAIQAQIQQLIAELKAQSSY